MGDCTCAAVGHAIQTWTANAGEQFIPSDNTILQLYEKSCGYDPNNPATDQGGVETTVLGYWKSNPVAGHALDAFASVDPHNVVEIKQAVVCMGVVYIGVALPISAQTQDVWDVTDPHLQGDSAPGSWGGHAVVVVGYNSRGPLVITWGKVLQMTWAFWLAYCDEAYALLSKDWLAKNGVSPSGFNYAQLEADMAAL